jgi:tetratricopeptide (TPR) repeat protein
MADPPVASGGAGHPDLEQIAAYADNLLSPSRRSAIESHLADCDDCRTILSDTTDFIAEPPARWRMRIVWGATGLAAAAVLVLAVLIVTLRTANAPRLEELVAAFANESTRPAEGRVSGGFAYAPPPAMTRGAATLERSPDVRIALGNLENAVAAGRSVDTLWALGVARLAVGNIDGAVTVIEEAAQMDSSIAPLQSDLSAAYFARARRSGDAADQERALAAADRAIVLQPDLPEALYNRALAVEALRRDETVAAWRALIERERDSDWAREAATHLPSTP